VSAKDARVPQMTLAFGGDLYCIECGSDAYKEIESAWQDAELRADTNLKRVEELEATLKTIAAQAMYAAGYTKKGGWKNEPL
jgi:hypothetical protein